MCFDCTTQAACFPPPEPPELKNMKRLFIAPVWICLVIASLGQAWGANDPFETLVQPFLAKNCVACHNEKLKSVNLSLETFRDTASAARHPELWAKVLDKLSAGKMPPPGQPP